MLERQLTELGVQRPHVNSRRGVLRLFGAEHVGSAIEQLARPRRDLIGVNIELLRQLDQRLVASDGSQSHLRLKRR